mmetsp:Transcript_7451/g.8147  ORF Transcript_7451/g.8147 Transcript_7451/m.8147 type:complete len:139 (+) Transcript_7451:36-452(+)
MANWTKKKYFKLAKGFRGRRRNCITQTIRAVQKGLLYAYRDRNVRPREMRKTYIRGINAAVQEHQVRYSNFIYGLNNSNIELNRRSLYFLALNEPLTFKAIVDEVVDQTHIKRESSGKVPLQQGFDQGYVVSKIESEN